MKKPCRARSVGIPSAPNALAIALVADDELVKRGHVEIQLALFSQVLNRPDENQISRPGTKTRRSGCWQNEKLSGFEMSGRLQLDGGEVRDGVFATGRHGPHLLENSIVTIFGDKACNTDGQGQKRKGDQFGHASN
ncbi:MAG: hypothetical protein JWO45_1783 [Spartobacteria bacterium]|nr:hypothetical protein [Spartobacteria bacterium]